jgi:hypothetical protein
MANIPEYVCTSCGKSCQRKDLVVKKALFTEMGEGARTVRARVIHWLCPKCLLEDTDFNREKFAPRNENKLAFK